MDLPAPQLAALVAVVDAGTFEAAARALHVTPSAVSQRIRALESAVGQVLVRRAAPCTATPAGATLVRLGRAQALLQAEARTALEPEEGRRSELGLAVNADSLATWFRDVLAEAAGWEDAVLRLEVEDQAHSHELPLLERHLAGGEPDWARMPVVTFNAKDTLQHDLLGRVSRGGTAPPTHRVPTSADFLEALALGLGWGMLPEAQLTPLEQAGRLVRVQPGRYVDVPLHWQRWRLDSALLARVTDAVRRAASAHLRRRSVD